MTASLKQRDQSFHEAPLTRTRDLVESLLVDATAAHEAFRSGRPRGPQLPFAQLNREVGNHLMPGIHTLHGSPGAGKTALALQVAASCGFPALFVTTEMVMLELFRRLIARETRTFLGRLKSGEIPGSTVVELARKTVAGAPDLAFLDATIHPATPSLIRDAAFQVKGEADGVLIVVDSLHSWSTGLGSGETEYDRLAGALDVLGTIAHEVEAPILLVCERNRASMKSGGLSAGAGHRGIEYISETVLDLDRAEGATPDVHGEIPVRAKFVKNRHGAPGRTVDLAFNGALQRFSEA
jgi:replicative DNA helicase